MFLNNWYQPTEGKAVSWADAQLRDLMGEALWTNYAQCQRIPALSPITQTFVTTQSGQR
jgi:hypothetical protein